MKKAVMKDLPRKGFSKSESEILSKMLLLQRTFNSKWYDNTDLPEHRRIEWCNKFITYLMQEAAEARDLLPYKHWKKKEKVDWLEYKYELIDMLKFLLSQFDLLGMEAHDIYSIFVSKYEENQNRQKRGY